MKILKLLNKFFIIFFTFCFFLKISSANEPIDIWKIEKNNNTNQNVIISDETSISDIVFFSISSILLSVSINSNSSFFDNILPIEDFPDPIMPTKTKFLFNFMSFYIEITQICRIFEIT